MNPEVNWFFNKQTKWQQAYEALRNIVLDCGLTEELKWGCPCYTYNSSNVVLIHGFKNYCALLFMKGALLNDAKKLLVQQTENVQAARQLRFINTDEITKLKTVIKGYINDAVKVEKAGLKVALKPTAKFAIPMEFEKLLKEFPELKQAFYKLTPGRQRGYLLHFSSAIQVKTREARIEKYLQKILDGKGLDD